MIYFFAGDIFVKVIDRDTANGTEHITFRHRYITGLPVFVLIAVIEQIYLLLSITMTFRL